MFKPASHTYLGTGQVFSWSKKKVHLKLNLFALEIGKQAGNCGFFRVTQNRHHPPEETEKISRTELTSKGANKT